MKRCAFLSMNDLAYFECYDHLLFEPLANYNWQVEEVPWRSPSADWDRYDAVVIRSPWDYQDTPELFIEVLQNIDASSALLENSLDIVRWNLDKRYLREMAGRGITIVPTLWREQLEADDLPALLDHFPGTEIIIKPVISANADHTYRIGPEVSRATWSTIHNAFTGRPLMVQPFMKQIIDEGEYSLFYFGGQYSHTVLKRPGPGDFRVQEEHGGTLEAVEPDDHLRATGDQTIRALPESTLYARADYVHTADNNFALMELELIEPSLYFNMDPASPERFARHFDRWMEDHL